MTIKGVDKATAVFQHVYPESRFGGFSERDGTIAFYNRVNALIRKDHHVLEIGCGRGGHQEDPVEYRRDLRVLSGKCALLTGIDVDEIAAGNPYLDRFLLMNEKKWPLLDDSVDVAIADHVLEHVADPNYFFAECQRVMKKDGLLCIRTTNKRGYVATIARLIPRHWLSSVIHTAQPGRKHEDVFVAEYKANNKKKLKKLLNHYGFLEHCVYTHESEPAYFGFSNVIYRIVAQWHRIAPAWLRNSIFVFARKVREHNDPISEKELQNSYERKGDNLGEGGTGL